LSDSKNIKTELFDFSNNFYSEKQKRLSSSLLDLLIDLNLDNESLISGSLLFADLSNPVIVNAITTKYGKTVLQKIELLQRLGNISFPDSKKQITILRKQFIEIADDLSIIFIKLAERLAVLKFSETENSIDLTKIADECLNLYSPIAHRLGLRVIYQQMDDIAFKHLFPDDYHKLFKAVQKRRDQLEKKLRDMNTELSLKLRENNIKASIQSRVKRLYSIYLKLKNKGVSLDDVFDLMALRIIVDKVEDCYFVLGIVHSSWVPIEGRFRDWVTYPKPNGYRSIQTTVLNRKGDKFEIQIRTQEMHRQAEFGSAAHWAYKEGEKVKDKTDWIARLKEFLETDEYFDNPYELQELLKSEQKRDYIHVLTPKGDIKTLRKDSTPIDFAYAIHTDLGSKVSGAKVNGKLSKLTTTLKSGDVVEIISSKNAKPSRDWLNHIKTPKARSKILIWLKKHENDQLVADGKRIWEKFKKQYRTKLGNNADEQSFKSNLSNIGFKSPEDFYSAISINSLKCSQTLLRKLYPSAFESKSRKKKFNEKDSTAKPPQIKVEGMKGIETKLSKCCNPIKGEPIIAYVTSKSEIKIHSIDCPYISSPAFEKDKFKKAEWIDTDSVQTASMKIIGQDYNDMLNYIVDEASGWKLIVKSLNKVKSNNKSICLAVEVEVKDIEQLRNFITKLEKSKFIDSVILN
jgi:GTP pyrophosphokinase